MKFPMEINQNEITLKRSWFKMIKQQINCANKQEIVQGDVFRKIPFFESFKIVDGTVDIDIITFPYVIVLTQVCDLSQENEEIKKDIDSKIKKNIADEKFLKLYDKKLISILVAPMYNAEHFWKGEHTSDLGHGARVISERDRAKIEINADPRYHLFVFTEESKNKYELVDMI